MPQVAPEVIAWARRTAGLDLDEAARKIGLRAARGVHASERLAAIERGEEEPTRALLLQMEKQYRRPLVTFYLATPPRRGDRGLDFRSTSTAVRSEQEPLLDALVRRIRAQQELIRAALVDEEGVEPLAFVGSKSVADGQDKLSLEIRSVLSFDLAAFRAQRTLDGAFSELRSKAEGAGVFVLLAGDLGSYHTALSVDVFRGYALADSIAPFIVINDRDARAAWSFTLLHEFCHLLLGYSGISGGYGEMEVERLCNDAASHLLLGDDELSQLAASMVGSPAQWAAQISDFAAARNISRTLVAYRLFRRDFLSRSDWWWLTDNFHSEWLDFRAQREQGDRERGPSYYTVRRHRLGKRLLVTVSNLLASGSLTTVKASRILGVKPKHVAEIIRETNGFRTVSELGS